MFVLYNVSISHSSLAVDDEMWYLSMLVATTCMLVTKALKKNLA